MIFIDRFSLKSCMLAYRLVLANNLPGEENCIHVLDPIEKSNTARQLLGLLRLRNIDVKEAEFYAGHLRTSDGENLWTAAQKALGQIAFNTAQKSLTGSKVLSALNEKVGRNTILLYLTRYFFRVAGYKGHHTIFKILVTDALSRDKDGEKHHLILGMPTGFIPDLFEGIRGELKLSTYSIKEWSIKNTRLSGLLLICYVSLKWFLKRAASIFQPKSELGDVTTPALLLLQEDDLSMDRSYRGQPHWLFQEDGPPKFRTLIINPDRSRFMEFDQNELCEYSIYSIPMDALYTHSGKHHVHDKIKCALRSLLYLSVFGSRAAVNISFELALLFIKASLLASFCKDQNVKAFMTCENYRREADAMNMIGPQMGIHTISYQYSNMSEVGPIMMTTADTMYTFSALFHDRWKKNGVASEEYANVGYIFDSSFGMISKRGRKYREELNKNVGFVITYFDESVQSKDNKYSLMHEEDHYYEILPLLNLVIDKTDTAVIIKSQFPKNIPSTLFQDDNNLKQAIQSGRFLELHHGKHRNNILPAEAAMASDLVIGHAVGATAVLEAALTGKRCVLLNPYNMHGANIEIFKQADILYEDINSALNAIKRYRNGETKYKDLGDWSPIIDLFDPFRDGQSGHRLRKLLEQIVMRDHDKSE